MKLLLCIIAVVAVGLNFIPLTEEGLMIEARFDPPEGCERVSVESGTFSEYLRQLPLKPSSAKVHYYDGRTKGNPVHRAVIDMSVGDRDLQQCADAVMRLRGEYLYSQERYNQLHFNLTNGMTVEYEKWMAGYRVTVDGNNTYYELKTEPSNTYEDFMNYMTFIFIYAGTLSLDQELESVNYEDMKIGDVFIQGGSPGHAVIVVDMAIDPTTQEKYYMLAQSYMPAQDIHVLKNPNDDSLSPWYLLDENTTEIRTPEWLFTPQDLHRF